jgi:hypothetical protein
MSFEALSAQTPFWFDAVYITGKASNVFKSYTCTLFSSITMILKNIYKNYSIKE